MSQDLQEINLYPIIWINQLINGSQSYPETVGISRYQVLRLTDERWKSKSWIYFHNSAAGAREKQELSRFPRFHYNFKREMIIKNWPIVALKADYGESLYSDHWNLPPMLGLESSHILRKKRAMDSQTPKVAHRIVTEFKPCPIYIARVCPPLDFRGKLIHSLWILHNFNTHSKQSIATSPVSKHDQLQSQTASHAGGQPTSSFPAPAADVAPHALHPQRHSAFAKS